ncbi:MAG: NUDIX hydrolase [Actinomycetota bacterium]|nr:MAG: NUDIX hydrolase [Actinomycetota bacterium]
MKTGYEVTANGGVLIQKGGHEKTEFFCALIHRPRYNDWSLPKGKQEEGEDPLACALRETLEETGYVCTPIREILSSSYTDNHGRSKLVRFWLMEVASGKFIANEEVDSLAWLPFHLAKNTLTYEKDRQVLESAETVVHQLNPI